MTILGVLLALIVLSVLVILHELGHFVAARLSGVTVDEFGLGLPPRIWGKKIGKTLVSINLLPFGGFVRPDEDSLNSKPLRSQAFITVAGVLVNFFVAYLLLTFGFFVGMEPLIASQEDFLKALNNGQIHMELQAEPQDDSVWLSHPVVNSALARSLGLGEGDILISINGETVLSPEQWQDFDNQQWSSIEVMRMGEDSHAVDFDAPISFAPWHEEGVWVSFFDTESTAEAAGLQVGDRVLTVDGREVNLPEDVISITQTMSAEVRYGVERDGQTLEFKVPLRDDGRVGVGLSQGLVSGDYELYFQNFPYKYLGMDRVAYGVKAPVVAIEEMGRLSKLTVASFAGLLKNFFSAQAVPEGVSGPVGILQAASTSAQEGWTSILRLAALLSLSLGVINLLPIPALDGGRLLFIGLRAVFGKRGDSKFETLAHAAGFFLLILIIIYLTVNDVSNLI